MRRSKVVGLPPRSRWPRTTLRVSLPVSAWSSFATRSPIPPSRSARPISRLHHRDGPALRLGALGDDDDRELAPRRVARVDRRRHLREVVRDLGDQDRVRVAGDAGVQRDPAGVAAHHLDDHDAAVRPAPSSAAGRGTPSRTSTAVSKPNVMTVLSRSLSIVFGTPTTRSPFFAKAVGDGERAVAADGDQRVDPVAGEGRQELVGAVDLARRPVGLLHRVLEGVAAVRRAEDRAAEMGDPPHALARQGDEAAVRDTAPGGTSPL